MSKIDVVYTLNDESNSNNNELRYSLRSLSRFANLGNVWIIGYLPKWIDPTQVIHLPASDPYLCNKDANLISKLIYVCSQPNLSDRFLWFSDDQVLLKDVDISHFERPLVANKHYYRINIPDAPLNRWLSRLKRTRDVLKERGFKYDCYEAHVPYLLDKKTYIPTLQNYAFGADIGYCGNTLYFNTINAHGVEPSDHLVCGIESCLDHPQQAPVLDTNLFLYYSDRAINENLFLYLHSLYPLTSIFEKNGFY